MSKNYPWKKEYNERRKRNVQIILRFTEEEKQQFVNLANSKNMCYTDLILYLTEKELEREPNN